MRAAGLGSRRTARQAARQVAPPTAGPRARPRAQAAGSAAPGRAAAQRGVAGLRLSAPSGAECAGWTPRPPSRAAVGPARGPRAAPAASRGARRLAARRALAGRRRGLRVRRRRRSQRARPLPGLPAAAAHRHLLPRLRRTAQRARLRARRPGRRRSAPTRSRSSGYVRLRGGVAVWLVRAVRGRPAAHRARGPSLVGRSAALLLVFTRCPEPAVRWLAAPLIALVNVQVVGPASTGCEAAALLRIPSTVPDLTTVPSCESVTVTGRGPLA